MEYIIKVLYIIVAVLFTYQLVPLLLKHKRFFVLGLVLNILVFFTPFIIYRIEMLDVARSGATGWDAAPFMTFTITFLLCLVYLVGNMAFGIVKILKHIRGSKSDVKFKEIDIMGVNTKYHFKMMPYLIVNVLMFYLLPIIIHDTATARFVTLLALPLGCFLTSIMFCIKNSFHWIYPLMVALLFAPTIFIFYNGQLAIYIIIYGVIALLGNLIGTIFYKSTK